MGRRLFVSIDLPSSLHDEVAQVQAPFAEIPGVRPTDPTQAHVTVKFLGEVEDDRVETVREELSQAVEDAAVDPFRAEFAGVGVFPEFDYISVIWVGVRTGATAMTRLHESIEEAMVSLGFDEERHEFTPHVTIARVEHGEGKSEIQELLRTRDPTVGETTVSEVNLTESTLTSDGPEYETLEACSL